MHLSVPVRNEHELRAGDVEVKVRSEDRECAVMSFPAPDLPLPLLKLRGLAAIADYTFQMDGRTGPFVATISLWTESVTVPLGGDTETIA